MNKLQTVAKGETVSRSYAIDVEAQTVDAVLTVKEDENATVSSLLHWTLDFSTCTAEEILRLAADSAKIRVQTKWRPAKDRMDADVWDNKVVDVHAMLAEGRGTPKTPVDKGMALVGRMSDADQAAFIAALTARMKAK